MEEILIEIEKEIDVHLKELKLELADIEYVSEGGYNYLRIYVEKENDITTLDDCIELSSKIDGIVDKFIEDKFFLEVSTPGLERKLKKEKDFIRFKGENIKLYSKTKIEDKKIFEGKLEDFKDNVIYIFDKNINKMIEIPLNKLKKANIIYKITNDSEEE